MRYFLPILLMFSFLLCQEYEDVVYLKNGSVIRGMIVEKKPNKYIKIKSGNNIFVYQMNEISKITKELISEESPTSKHPYGKNTENWYTLWGLGPSFTNNFCNENNNDCLNNSSSGGIEILGFYKHISANSLIGFIISGKFDVYNDSGLNLQYNQYLYSLSSINYINTFGKGPFFRVDLGASKANVIYTTSFSSDVNNSDWGSGILLGGGYSFDFTKTRLLVGLYYTANQIEGFDDNYLNLIISGLF